MRGLLHRIGAGHKGPVPALESVISHLRAMFSTHVGDGPSCPSYGLNVHRLLLRWPMSGKSIADDIRGAILRHEPRLEEVEVRSLPHAADGTLRIEIVARMPTAGMLTMEADLTGAGCRRLRVSELAEAS